MKLHCFSKLHPLVLFIYYFFLLIFAFYFGDLIFVGIVFFAVVILNYFCGCIRETLDFLKYFLVFGLLILISNIIFMQAITIFTLINFISFCAASILFLSFNKIIDSEKFIYLVSKISPHLALILNICVRYIFLLQKRLRDFICVCSLNNNGEKKLEIIALLVTKIFDWSINDCVEMIEILKAKNYTGLFTHYKFYKMSRRDVFFMSEMIFSCIGIFICKKNFLFVLAFLISYLLLPFAYDFICYARFFIGRKIKND